MINNDFYKNKKVLITGHTGFKGTWLSVILESLGANVFGYSLKPPTNPSLFSLLGFEKNKNSIIGDIRNFKKINEIINTVNPEIVFHLAAQPIVTESYKDPILTYETNVMGTVYLFEAIRKNKSVRSVVNVTTDKVYKNNEWEWGYRETDELNGFDPYSNSKSCSELVTNSYKNSFFNMDKNISVSTARAGNVIGGGDFAINRIIPDCIRAVMKNETIIVRNPYSIRPYQHVLEPLISYLIIAEKQYEDKGYSGCYNIGPDDENCIKTGDLVDIFCDIWGDNANWKSVSVYGPHEANFLKLDCSKFKSTFSWRPKWDIDKAVEQTCIWSKAWINNENLLKVMNKQVENYLNV